MESQAASVKRHACVGDDEWISESELEPLFATQTNYLRGACESADSQRAVEILTNFGAVVSQRLGPTIAGVALSTNLVNVVVDVFRTCRDECVIVACIELASLFVGCGSDDILEALVPVFSKLDMYIDECDNELVVGKTLMCISRYAAAVPGDDFDLPFNLTLDVLLTIRDRFPRLCPAILCVCASVLAHRPNCYLCEQLFSVAVELIVDKKDGGIVIRGGTEVSAFFDALTNLVKYRSRHKIEMLEELRDSNFYELLTASVFSTSAEAATAATLKLWLALTKCISEARGCFVSLVDILRLIQFAKTHEGKLRALAYRLIGRYVKLRCSSINALFDEGLAILFHADLEEGSYEVRCAAMMLITKILKYGRGDPRVGEFTSSETISLMLSFLDVSAPKLDKAVIKYLLILMQDTTAAFPMDDSVCERLTSLATTSTSLFVRVQCEYILNQLR